MKPKSALRSLLCISLLVASPASAQTTYYWDSNDGTAGFGGTAGTWAAPTNGTATAGLSTDSTGGTAVNGNSVTTTTADTVNFGTNTTPYTGATTISGTVNVGSIYMCPTHSTGMSAISSPVINFGATGIFETAKDTTFGLPALTITGAATSLTWRSTRTLQLFNITSSIPNTSKYILQTSPDSILPYPGRVAVSAAAQLGPAGTALEFDGATLRIVAGLPYASLSALNTDHPVSFMPNKNAGFDNTIQFGTFTVDLPMNLGTGKFFAEGRNDYDTTVQLTQANTMAETILTSGTLEISASNQLGAITSPIRFGTGTVSLLSGCLRIAGTSMTSFGARPVLLTADKAVALDIADAANTFTFNTALTQGLGAFVKRGPGTLILTQNNTYTGTTTVSAGTLIINGNQTLANGAVSIAANATLGGTGTIGGSTTISANGKLAFNISTAAGSHDKLELASGKTLTFSGVSTLTISSASGASIGDYVLLTAPGGITGSAPATLNLPAGWAATVTKENSNQDLVLHVTTVGVSGYAAWKGANAGGQNPDLDFDNDGVENGVEYFMNAAAGFTANPALNSSNTITWPNGGNIPASAYGTQFVIQTSSDLSTWADVAAGSLTANTNGPGGSLTYTLTGASPRFVRLKVTPN